MRWSRQTILINVLVWVVATLMAGCALAPPREVPTQTGRVLDEETQQPIEGAIVVVQWSGVTAHTFIPVDSRRVCYHAESALSDGNGRFKTRSWEEERQHRGLSGKRAVATAYKAGYRHVRVDMATGDQYLKMDMGSVKDRLEYLSHIAVSCGADRADQLKLLPFYKALYQEANNLAETKEEKKKALYRLLDVEQIEIGYDEAWRRLDSRVKALK